ncbi:MAG: GHMP family kinase ATP-binding protein [Mobilitalea sp.]
MDTIARQFVDIFGLPHCGQIRSPLRICPLGAHIDHQGGLVTGMALNVNVDLLYAPDDAGFVKIQSMDFPDEEYFHIDQVPEMLPGFWGNYIRGSVLSLSRDFKLRKGLKAVIRGRLPMGGLSSSAAVTTAYLMALADVNGIEIPKEKLIQYSHWVETAFIGLKNGILDQSSNILSKDGYLMRMDCATSEWELIPKSPSMPDFEVVIVNSGFTKALIGTDYNNRVDECKIAALLLQELSRGATTPYKDIMLHCVTRDEWVANRDSLPGRFGRRAKHYFTENQRVIDGTEAWKQGDIETFGKLVVESGESSVHDYQCGSPELITIFDVLKNIPGVHGARFSGAGYRGCCIGIVDSSRHEEIEGRIAEVYPVKHPQYADKYKVYFCKTADGASYITKCGTRD